MNELAQVCSKLQKSSSEIRNRAKTIYALCRSVTPQFYKHTPEEMNVMVTSIQLLIQEIREDVLAKMCEIAVREYPKSRSRSPKNFFDINYILTFYDKAWDEIRPKDYCYICEVCTEDGKLKVGYCRDCDFDTDTWKAKPNADIWWDE